jgi:hypothetical protein
MPIAQTKWESVALLHNKQVPWQARTAELICPKFQEFIHETSPTGNPNCPAYICHAKLINMRFVQMIDGSTGGFNGRDLDDELEEKVEQEDDKLENPR